MEKEIIKKLKSNIENMYFADQVSLWNEYASAVNPDDYIWGSVAEMQDTMDFEPMDLAQRLFYGNVESLESWVMFNGYANIETVRELPDLDALCGWLFDNEHFIAECNVLWDGTSWDFETTDRNEIISEIIEELMEEYPSALEDDLLHQIDQVADWDVSVKILL